MISIPFLQMATSNNKDNGELNDEGNSIKRRNEYMAMGFA